MAVRICVKPVEFFINNRPIFVDDKPGPQIGLICIVPVSDELKYHFENFFFNNFSIIFFAVYVATA